MIGAKARHPNTAPGKSWLPSASQEENLLAKTLFVGNLSWNVTDDELADVVGRYAEVISARVATDRESGRSRGFGFVEVPEAASAAVIDALDGFELDGRPLTVNEARPREERRDRRGGGGYGRAGRW